MLTISFGRGCDIARQLKLFPSKDTRYALGLFPSDFSSPGTFAFASV